MEYNYFDSDDDDELFIAYLNYGCPKVHRQRTRLNHFSYFDDETFAVRFRMSKETVMYVYEQISKLISPRRLRGNVVPPLTRLLVALRFYATGNFYNTISEFVGIGTGSAGNFIRLVSQAISMKLKLFVRLPVGRAKEAAKETEFARLSFPCVIGAIDCTHVKILPQPGMESQNWDEYRCCENYFSIKFQAICDAKLRFIDITPCYPGSTEALEIFNNSRIKAKFEMGEIEDGYLLGDGKYVNKKYLLTSIPNPRSDAETLYNECHYNARSTIDTAFKCLKKRFPILTMGIRCKLTQIPRIVDATIVLHNLAVCVNDSLTEPEVEPEDGKDGITEPSCGTLQGDCLERERLVHEYFSQFTSNLDTSE